MAEKVYQVKVSAWADGYHIRIRAETGMPLLLDVNVRSSFDIPRKLLEFLGGRRERFVGTVPVTGNVLDLLDYFLVAEPKEEPS